MSDGAPEGGEGARGLDTQPGAPGVLLLAYGGPDRLDQVEAYYTDIRRGSPPPPELLAELLDRYRAIGGRSPLSDIVERQRVALAVELGRRDHRVPVYAGMRHIQPRIAAVVEQMAADGVRRIVALPLAPHRSLSTEAYRRAVVDALAGPGIPVAAAVGAAAPALDFVGSWHEQPRLIEALADATDEALARFPDRSRVGVLFTAHSLPLRLGPDAERYRRDVERTAALVADRLGLARHFVALQSAGRTGEAWLGPELRDEIRRLAESGLREIVVCPVGFVADHLEVLYDIDIEAQAVARESGVHLERAPSMNDRPTFIAGLADLVVDRLVG